MIKIELEEITDINLYVLEETIQQMENFIEWNNTIDTTHMRNSLNLLLMIKHKFQEAGAAI